MIPVQLRVGGAFMALAIVLIIQAVISFVRGEAVYVVTVGSLCIWVAALLLGGFATTQRDQKASRAQVIALAIAVVLVIASVVLPTISLLGMQTYWLALYAAVALVCALILRRATV